MIDEDLWDDVLAFIEEGSLIPVLGPELLQIQVDGKSTHLYRYIAEALAQRYNLPAPQTRYGELDDVVRAYLKGDQRDVSALYRPIWDILSKSSGIATPPALLQLAEIRQLNWFVATTFDGLMVRALDQTRFAGQQNTSYLHFSPNRPREETEQIARRPPADRAMVYAMFGKVSASPSYAIHDEDLLEFVHALVSLSALSPESWLADELRKKNLLLLGVHFSDWVSRFIMRLASTNRLSMGSERKVFVVGEGIGPDSQFAEFLRLFARRTRVCEASAAEFVSALRERWLARHPSAAAAPADATNTMSVLADTQQKGSIFISYVREDIEAARAMQGAITGMGGDVWLDERRLQPGDRWKDEILASIRRRVRLFLPLISQQTENRETGFVFREWREAAERSAEFPPGERSGFIVPVVIDQKYDGNINSYRHIEESFREVHIDHAPNGLPSAALLSRLKDQIRAIRR